MSDHPPCERDAVEPVVFCCPHCGSDAIVRDAWLVWEPTEGEWVLDEEFDACFCRSCEKTLEIEDLTQEKARL